MKQRFILLLLVILLGAFLRFFQLGTNPPSLDWDEASLGYNAYSLLKTGKDEYGRTWPVSIKSFGDYKPAMYTYLTIPSVAVFGMTEFAVRLPSAIIGTLALFLCCGLLSIIFGHKAGLLATLLLAISPWHIQFSRIAFETNVGLFFVIAGAYFFLKAQRKPVFYILSAILFAASFYSYHSPRLVVPFLLLGWMWFQRRSIFKFRNHMVSAGVIGFVLLIPFLVEVFTVGGSRFGSVTVITPEALNRSIEQIEHDLSKNDPLGKFIHNRRIIYGLAVVKGYLDHFNLDFLFLSGDASSRHHASDMGVLYIWEAPFILVGSLLLLKHKKAPLLFWWFLVAPLASAFTSGTPHAVRSLLYLPTYQLFTSVGLISAYNAFQKKLTYVRNIFWACLFVIIGLATYYYLESYFVHTPVEVSEEWQYGYKQAIAAVMAHQNSVDKVIITYTYDQPYVYLLFYGKVDPEWYQSLSQNTSERAFRSFDKYEFRKIEWDKDNELRNALLVGTPHEIPAGATGLVEEIYFLNGEVAFRIVKR